MEQNSAYIELLVYKFNTGTISTQELDVLKDWYNSHDDELVHIITKQNDTLNTVKSRMLDGLLAKINETETKPSKNFRIWRWAAATAAIFVLMLGSWLALNQEKPQVQHLANHTNIEPGGNKATLTLANGKTIALSSAQTGILTGKDIRYNNGQPIGNTANGNANEGMLSLQTPRGGTYKITLPDGTEVWLNAASKITYPSQFEGDTRVVRLEGEAYFNVQTTYDKSHQKIPFRVITNQQEIEVLGTQFNVNAYLEEASVKTTLVEGKVAINNKQGRTLLLPNQQAETTGANTKVKPVNVYNYVAWREGKFSFDGKTFKETMDEIARWYDLKIVYENGVPDEELIGDAYRNQNIHFVLQLLEKVAQVNYKLDVSRRQLTIGEKKPKL
ncbi:FecR family protein [Pedobacter sp. SL55]|uniref:FecR family protein n=1 Tax=Pedobacter sp. SL55 TaxID=2995161 RepID=UPI00227075B0|nr:FecR family protein [Pedobacter sp. SL55]WAC39224.1 FecR family protein [Pedobacter sp. SL55]